MSKLSVLGATTALALVAATGAASAQATNMSRHSGEARAYYGNGTDLPGFNNHAMQRRGYQVHRGYIVAPRAGWHGPYRNRYWRTEGIPPALYHAGDPQYWR